RLHLGDHRLGSLEALSRDLEAVSHGPPHRVVPLLYADVVPEEVLPLRGRAVEQHLEPTREVSDDRIEGDEKVLGHPFRELVFRGVYDYARVEDRLAGRVQGGV